MAIHTLYLQRKGYTSKEDRQLLEDILGSTERVLDESGLIATAPGGGSYQVSVSAGRCLVRGDTNTNQGMYRLFSDAVETRSFTPHATNPRVDLLAAQVSDFTEVGSGADQGDIVIVPGTATAGADIVNLTGAPGQGGGPVIPASTMPLWYVQVPVTGGITTAGLLDYRPRLGGSSLIATEESRTNVAFGLLPTPDVVRRVVIPSTKQLLAVVFNGLIKSSVAAAGSAAIFIGSNQAKIYDTTAGGAAVVQQTTTATANRYAALWTAGSGIAADEGTADMSAPVTTGQILGTNSTIPGGLTLLQLYPGTYDISIQFKATSGSVSAKERRMWVYAIDPTKLH